MRHTTRVPERERRARPAYRLLSGLLLLLATGLASATVAPGVWQATAEDGELGFELAWEGEPLVGRFRRFEMEIESFM